MLSKNAVKIYKNLKNPLSVASERGFSFKAVVKFNKHLSIEAILEGLKELEQEGLIKSENGKIKVIK